MNIMDGDEDMGRRSSGAAAAAASASSELATGHPGDWLYALLKEEEMECFYDKIYRDLMITRIQYFDFVKAIDLERLGISAPRAKALLATVRKKRNAMRAQKVINKIFQPVRPLLMSSASAAGNRNLIPGFRSGSPQSMSTQSSSAATATGTQIIIIRNEELTMMEKLGGGSFGYVQKAQWINHGLVAVKVLKQEAISSTSQPDVLEDFNKEVISMLELNHPNLIKLFGIVLGTPLKMVTELAPLGSLRDLLRKEKEHTPISELTAYSVQIADGMKYLESKRYLHRDLATRNILLTSENRRRVIKIADFGLMRALDSQTDCYVMNEHKRVPFPWCAPESLKTRHFSTASDVWMFAVTLWEMFTFGGEPWAGLNGGEILQKIDKEEKRLDQPDACSDLIYAAMLKCWHADPSERPTFDSLHSFFQELRTDECTATSAFDKDSPLPKLNATTSPPPPPPSPKRKLMSIEVGDKIQVIDGRAEHYFWKGQNQRTFRIGLFPRCIVVRKDRKNDHVSKPLRNSFIHTGHQGIDGPNWGNPTSIDDMYLKYPADPPDLMHAPVKELPPIPKLLSGKNSARVTSPKRRESSSGGKQQFSYNRFQNDSATAERSLASLFFGRKYLDKNKEAAGRVKRSASFNQLDRKGNEGMLIDFSDEIPVQSFVAAEEMDRFHGMTRTSSTSNLSKYPATWQSFDAAPNEDQLYVNVPSSVTQSASAFNASSNKSLVHSDAAAKANATISAIAGLYDNPAASECGSRDNYSMFNDEDWAACGMSTATGAGGPSTRYGSTFSGENCAPSASYESQAQIDWHQQNQELMRNRPGIGSSFIQFNPNSLIHTHPAFNKPTYSQFPFTNSPSNPAPATINHPPPPPVSAASFMPSNTSNFSSCFETPVSHNFSDAPVTSLFGCPSFSSNSSAVNGVVKQRPGFIYKDKGPAPAPPTLIKSFPTTTADYASHPDPCDHPYSNFEALVAAAAAVPLTPDTHSTTATTGSFGQNNNSSSGDVGDFMKELESKLSLYNRSKEVKQQDTQSGASNSSSGIPALRPPPAASASRVPRIGKQMQVVPPLQSSSSSTASSQVAPSAPMRETLYGLPTIGKSSDGIESMIDGLLSKVATASREDCRKSLFRNNMDSVSALKDLQTSQLMRLGIANKTEIETALRATNWDLESAASRLLDMGK